MSEYSQLVQMVTALTNRLNDIEINGKKIDELNQLSTLNPSSKIHVSVGGQSFYVEVSQLIDAISNANHDHIVSINGDITVVGDLVTVPEIVWILSNIIYQTSVSTPFTIPYCASGLNRKDIFVLNSSNQVVRMAGPEDADIVIKPNVPIGTLYLTEIDVSDSAVGTPIDPVIGTQFVKKNEFAEILVTDSGDITIGLDTESTAFVLTGAVTSVIGFEVSSDFISNNNYVGKEIRFTNNTGADFPITHNGASTYPARFPSEVDFVLKNNETIFFKPVKRDVLFLQYCGVGRDVINYSDIVGAPTINEHFKGKYTSEANLIVAHPTAADGDYAIVDSGSGTNALEYIWDTDEGWVLGNSTGASTTDALTEGSANLYHTSARVLSTVLSGLSLATGGTIVSTDTVLQAFGKIQKQINDLTSVFVPLTRTITINGTTSDLSADRTFLTKAEVLEWFTGDEYSVQATGAALSLYGMATPTTVGTASNVSAIYAGTYVNNPITFSNHRISQTGTGAGSFAEFYEATQKLVANGLGFVFHGKSGFTWSSGTADYTGLTGSNAATGNVNPSTLLDSILFGADDTDTNLQFMHNDGSGTATKHDMGSNFALQSHNAYNFMIWNLYGGNTVDIWLRNLKNGAIFQTSVNTDLPASTVGLAPHLWTGNRGTTNNVAKKFTYFKIQRQY